MRTNTRLLARLFKSTKQLWSNKLNITLFDFLLFFVRFFYVACLFFNGQIIMLWKSSSCVFLVHLNSFRVLSLNSVSKIWTPIPFPMELSEASNIVVSLYTLTHKIHMTMNHWILNEYWIMMWLVLYLEEKKNPNVDQMVKCICLDKKKLNYLYMDNKHENVYVFHSFV